MQGQALFIFDAVEIAGLDIADRLFHEFKNALIVLGDFVVEAPELPAGLFALVHPVADGLLDSLEDREPIFLSFLELVQNLDPRLLELVLDGGFEPGQSGEAGVRPLVRVAAHFPDPAHELLQLEMLVVHVLLLDALAADQPLLGAAVVRADEV